MYAYAASDNSVNPVSSDNLSEDLYDISGIDLSENISEISDDNFSDALSVTNSEDYNDQISGDSYDTVSSDLYDIAGEDNDDSVSGENSDLLTGLRPLEYVEIDASDIDPDDPTVYLDLTGDEPSVSYSGFEEEIYSDPDDIDNLGGAVYVDDYWDQYTTYYSYNQMNSKEKALYNALSKVCINALTTGKTYSKSDHGFTLGNVSFSGLSSSRAMNIGRIFYKQNPQYYFLNGWVGWSGYSGSTSGNLQLYGYPIFANGSSRTEITSQIRSQLDAWMSQIKVETTALGKEKKAHDLLIGHTSYEFGKYDQSIYSAIIERQTVCSGYAGTMMMLFNAAGFDSEVMCSKSHAWNTIRINGTWYYVDATWDDTGYGYSFFNLSDSEMRLQDRSDSHTPDALFRPFLPMFTRNGAGSLPNAYGKLDAPIVAASLKSGNTYTVMVTGADTADVWYTTSTKGEAPDPGSAYSKAVKYTKPFNVKYGTSVKVKAEKYDYLDSDVVECTRWVRSCKITYNLSKGENDPRNPSVFMSDDAPFELYAPTKEGYSFDGWYTDKKYTNKVTTIVPEDYHSNLQLYAKWLKDCIILSDNLIFINDGETATINARLAPETAVDKTISWKTDDSTAVSVVSADNSKITVRASASDIQKKVVITATNPNVSAPAECIVIVRRKTAPDRIIFNKSKINLVKGDETGLILNVDPADAVYDSITYNSSSSTVASVTASGSADDRSLTIKALSPGETVISARIRSSKGADLTCSCTVTVSGDETKTASYTDTRSAEDLGKTFWIGGIDPKGYAYTGKPIKPDVRVYMEDHVLKQGKDYTVSYKNNTKLNDGSVPSKAPCVTVKFIGNYKGTLTKYFKIIDDPEHAVITEITDISKLGEDALTVKVDKAVVSKGGSKPGVSVKIRSAEGVKELKEGRDYKLAYSSNTSVSKQGRVKITGMGDYKGSLTVQYEIATQSLRNLNMSIADFCYSKSKNAYKKTAVTITDLDGKMLKAGTDYSVEYEVADRSNAPAVGTDIYVTVTGKGNYTDSITGVIVVKPKTIAKASAVIYENDSYSKVQKNFTYTGSYIEPHYIRLNIGTAKAPVYLTEGVDFEVAGYRNNIEKGKASVVLRGVGEYGGIKVVDYNITVRNVNN